MALYREHKGLLADSLATTIRVYSLDDVQFHYSKDPYFKTLTDYKCEYYGEDSRVEEWQETYLVSAVFDKRLIPIGFSNALLE